MSILKRITRTSLICSKIGHIFTSTVMSEGEDCPRCKSFQKESEIKAIKKKELLKQVSLILGQLKNLDINVSIEGNELKIKLSLFD